METGRLFTKQRRTGDRPSFEYNFWQRDMIPYDGEITRENINESIYGEQGATNTAKVSV